ncbi:hypothetical protein CEXT_218731 [Caerostris extrusa]|uniref:Uncharacterized protein n=1 Tax=Caerostris extrusa TaxID=172846 RepID=A0AAV4XCH2_CAEEX|nr:hypothetical protein CEXT_218731 [Caerostris extrusa]
MSGRCFTYTVRTENDNVNKREICTLDFLRNSENARLFANHLSYQNDASNAHISLGADVHPCSDLSTVLPPLPPPSRDEMSHDSQNCSLFFQSYIPHEREMYYCIIKNGKAFFLN